MKFKLTAVVIAILTLFSACTLTDDKPGSLYISGVFIINEGPFGSGTGTISHYNRNTSELTNDVYGKQNGGAALGNILQSMTFYKNKYFLVLNNSNKIVAVDDKNFTLVSSYDGFSFPRYMHVRNDTTAYISEWGSDPLKGSVKEFDLPSKKVTKTLFTGKGADKLLPLGNRIYVVNNNGFGKDSTLAYFTLGDTIVNKITLSLGPNSLTLDSNGDIWVLCGGHYQETTGSKLIRLRNGVIDPSATFNLPKGAKNLVAAENGNTLYFQLDNDVWQKDLLNFGVNPPSVFIAGKTLGIQKLYGLGVDPKSGYMYCADAIDYISAGKVYIIDPSTKTVKQTLTVGINPNGFYFR